MAKLFLTILCLLSLASVAMVMTATQKQAKSPLIYWKSDPNPQRFDQIELFGQWIMDQGHVTENGLPVVELKLDAANNQSMLIQAVSGVGGDIMDVYNIPQYQAIGVLKDITHEARESGFSLDKTYPGLKLDLSVGGKQYGYPCNAAVPGLWCNVDAFKKVGMKAPPEIWTPEVFERIGKEFVEKANKGEGRQEYFFCSPPDFKNFLLPICRSQGLDAFNETLTECILNDPRYVAALKLNYKWTYEDHLFPSAAEVLSMNTQSGYGGTNFAQFQSGRFAMIVTGRYCLIRMRESSKPINLSLSRIPQFGFQNMVIYARPAALYKGSENSELAKLFFAFLAGEAYNNYIIKGSDGLPPNPKYAIDNPAYLRPRDYPNEGNTHQRELEWALNIALPAAASAYYKSTGMEWFKYGIAKYLNGLCTAEQAAEETARRVNYAIQTTIKANPLLKKQYESDCEIQKKIDQYKAQGEKLPAEWIKNPFYKAYYQSKGMLADGDGGDK